MQHPFLKFASALAAAAIAAGAFAQKPDSGGAAVVSSEPGKATVARAAQLSAQVVGIDKATRTLALKGPKGDVVDIVAGEEVRNFDQVKVGDFIAVRYLEALTLELRKTKVAAGDVTVREEAARSKPGERPAGVMGREVSAIAEVTALDPAKSTITIKGPRGNVATLNVLNPDQFKVVKKGDQIEVTYTEALAISLEPTAAPKR
jgi:ribosomal 50S subunit-recycling heat shock protein